MAKKKAEKYCPLDNIPVVNPIPDSWTRVARNLYVSKNGWKVWYYHNKEWFTEDFGDREEVCSAYPGVPERYPLERRILV